MEELYRRVELLGRLLEGTTSFYQQRLEEVDAVAERTWTASSLLAKLLQHAELAHPPIVRAAAAGALAEPALLDALEARGWVRWVLGKMEISEDGLMEVVRATRTSPEGISEPAPPDGAMLAALERLVQLSDVRERQPLTLEPATVQELIDAHRRAHPATPSFDELASAGWFAQDGARVILRRHQELLGRAAAELWRALAGIDRGAGSSGSPNRG